MKPILIFLLLQFLTISLPCTAKNVTQPVYDTEGSILNSKKNYYILPAKHASGGGLRAMPTGLRCLHFVFQERNGTLLGTTMRFTPPLPRNPSASEPIFLSSDIWIEFHDFDSFCSDMLDCHLTAQTPEIPQPLSGRLLHVAAGNEDGVWGFPD
uniref:Uncharacterized protein n=1 Tax=Avena sativa TaxID=4498 RepID=A0ACD5U328_AVESA